MLNGWEILKLRLQYGALDEAGYHDLLSSTLDSLGRKEVGPLHHLILEAGIDLRPVVGSPEYPPDAMRWKYWLAVALCYFKALAQNEGVKIGVNTALEVRAWIKNKPRLSQVLLFGDRGAIYSVLQQDFNSKNLLIDLPQASPEQAKILKIIHYSVGHETDVISRRQVGNWTGKLRKEWSEGLQRRLQVGILVKSARVLNDLADWLSSVKEGADPDEFQEFMEQFQKAGLDWAYGLTVVYDTQLARRYRQMSILTAPISFGSTLVALVMAAEVISIGLKWIPGMLVASVCLILLFGLTLFLLTRFFVIAFIARGNVEDQIEALNKIRDRYLTSDPQPNNPPDKKPED